MNRRVEDAEDQHETDNDLREPQEECDRNYYSRAPYEQRIGRLGSTQTVRAMIALTVVGSFMNVLLFGADTLKDHFAEVISAFGALSGAIVGFYFGTRGAQKKDDFDGRIKMNMHVTLETQDSPDVVTLVVDNGRVTVSVGVTKALQLSNRDAVMLAASLLRALRHTQPTA